MITLSIDTSSNEMIFVSLTRDGKIFERKEKLEKNKAQVLLPLIDELLTEQSLAPKDITAITVHPGPGSFTGLRIGVAVANTLSDVLHVPINGKAPGTVIEPLYE